MRYDPKRILSLAANHFALLNGWVGMASGGLAIPYRQIRSSMTLAEMNGDARDLIRTLVEVGLLEPTPGEDDRWDIPQVIASFIRHLTSQQNLLLDGAIRGIVSDLEAQVTDLEQSLQGYGRTPSEVAEELVRNISHARRLSEDHAAAVLNTVTKIKIEDGSRPVRERYEAIMNLFERHLEPMRAVIDVNGSLERVLDRILAITVSDSPAGEFVQRTFIRLRNYTMQLKREAIRHFRESMEEVFPLYEKSRREHALAVMVTKAIDLFRKGGAEAWDIQTHMPISRFTVDSLFSSVNAEEYLAIATEFQPELARKNLMTNADSAPPPLIPDIESLQLALANMPIGTDILDWLFSLFLECDESEVLCSYFALDEQSELRAFRDENKVTHHFRHRTYTYYPLRSA